MYDISKIALFPVLNQGKILYVSQNIPMYMIYLKLPYSLSSTMVIFSMYPIYIPTYDISKTALFPLLNQANIFYVSQNIPICDISKIALFPLLNHGNIFYVSQNIPIYDISKIALFPLLNQVNIFYIS